MEDVQTSSAVAEQQAKNKSVLIDVPTPHTFDLGNLLVNDPNPVSSHPSATELATIARTCAQSLLNQLLTTCPIHTSRSDSSSANAGSVLMQLPPSTSALPREKPLPKAKEKTTWEKFAEKKGIRDKKKGEGKMEFDEEKGEWVPKWGYKGKGGGDEEWIVEVDEKKKKKDEVKNGGGRITGRQGKEKGERTLGEGRRERKENARRNERKMRANEKKARRGRGGD